MSLFTFSSKKLIYQVFFILITFIILNIIIYFLPKDYYEKIYEDAISYGSSKKRFSNTNFDLTNIKILSFGDSKATGANHTFFKKPTLSLAVPNNTIIFSKKIFDELKKNKSFKPQYVILNLGANNFNKNGVFTKRDYAIRRLLDFSELFSFLKINGGFDYTLDGIISKLFPIYGRRIEIRHPRHLYNLILTRNKLEKIPGMIYIKDSFIKPKRDANLDKNYELIYERSIYNKFELSKIHTHVLEKFLNELNDKKIKVIIVQLPVDVNMQKLKDKLVGNKFENYLLRLKEKFDFVYIKEFYNLNYEFLDVNHLSISGHKAFINDKINPLIK